MREGRAFKKDGWCYECGVPRSLDAGLLRHGDRLYKGGCRYKGVLIQGFITMYIHGFSEGIGVLQDWFDRDDIVPRKGGQAIAWFQEKVE